MAREDTDLHKLADKYEKEEVAAEQKENDAKKSAKRASEATDKDAKKAKK